jgi:hypothetical protein
MKKLLWPVSYCLLLSALLLFAAVRAHAGSVSVGAAPQGDAKTVATKIIKYNFPECKQVSSAVRLADGSIRANCDGTNYRVFTVYSAREGQMLEVAMNCTAAKRLLNVDCY